METPTHLEPWSGDAPTLAAIKEIYLASFPAEEQRPWDDLESRARTSSGLRLLVIRRGGKPAGFITAWDLGAFLYIEHFAIDPAMRGGGLGARALAEVKAGAGKPVVVEVEREDAGDDARRRIGFYRRCGFAALSHYDYVQPPYGPGQPAVPLLLMSTDAGIDADATARTLHAQIYGAEPNSRK